MAVGNKRFIERTPQLDPKLGMHNIAMTVDPKWKGNQLGENIIKASFDLAK